MAGRGARSAIGQVAGTSETRRDPADRPVVTDDGVREAQVRAAAALLHRLSLLPQGRRQVARRAEGLRRRASLTRFAVRERAEFDDTGAANADLLSIPLSDRRSQGRLRTRDIDGHL